MFQRCGSKLVFLLIVCALLLLSGCGGGGGSGTGSNTVTAQISSSSPVVTLPSVATFDFTGQTQLFGKTVTVARITDPTLNAIATDTQVDLDTDLSDPNTIQVTVPVPPSGIISATVNAPNAIRNLGSSQAVTVYVYSFAGSSDDGEDTVEPLPATVSTASNTISINLPAEYFQPSASGAYVANLKIGVASTSAPPVTLDAETSASKAALPSGQPILCPLQKYSNHCTERSRFNPKRYRNGVPSPHFGMDLNAAVGTNVYLPSGGKLIPKRSCLVAACATQSGGIRLSVDYVTFHIRLLHLSNVVLSAGATTSDAVAVAQTGNTGNVEAHLHYEVYVATVQNCTDAKPCKPVFGRTDPFPFIASKFTVSELNKQTVLANPGEYTFAVSAFDLKDIPVTSAVGNPGENGGQPPLIGPYPKSFRYDPTRKICVSVSAAGVLKFPNPDKSTTFSGIAFGSTNATPSYCAPWTTPIAAEGLATQPGITVDVRYSKDATVSVGADPLSVDSASLSLAAAAPATVSLVANPTTVQSGGSVSLVATLVVPNGSPLPTGSVTFVDQSGATLCSSVAIDSNRTATCNATIVSSTSSDSVSANYSGDSNYAASSGLRTISVTSPSNGNYYVYYFIFQNILCGTSETASLQIIGGGASFSANASPSTAGQCGPNMAGLYDQIIGPVSIALKQGVTYTATFTYSGNGGPQANVGYEIDAFNAAKQPLPPAMAAFQSYGMSANQQGQSVVTFTAK